MWEVCSQIQPSPETLYKAESMNNTGVNSGERQKTLKIQSHNLYLQIGKWLRPNRSFVSFGNNSKMWWTKKEKSEPARSSVQFTKPDGGSWIDCVSWRPSHIKFWKTDVPQVHWSIVKKQGIICFLKCGT